MVFKGTRRLLKVQTTLSSSLQKKLNVPIGTRDAVNVVHWLKGIYRQEEHHHAYIVENSLSVQPQCMWKFVKESNGESVTTITLRDYENYITDPVDVASIFVSHFSACFSTSNGPLPSSNINCMDYLTVAPISASEVLEAIKKFKPKFSTGANGLPSFI